MLRALQAVCPANPELAPCADANKIIARVNQSKGGKDLFRACHTANAEKSASAARKLNSIKRPHTRLLRWLVDSCYKTRAGGGCHLPRRSLRSVPPSTPTVFSLARG